MDGPEKIAERSIKQFQNLTYVYKYLFTVKANKNFKKKTEIQSQFKNLKNLIEKIS